jgi:sirohydrochlorin cobaltochelatase
MPDTQSQEKLGLMICGHGSRNKEAVGQFAKLAERLRPRFPDWPVDYGYLEFANPVLSNGLDKLVEQGCTHILAVPGMLFAAGHAKNDIPSVLNAYQANNPGVKITYGREFGLDLKMIRDLSDDLCPWKAAVPCEFQSRNPARDRAPETEIWVLPGARLLEGQNDR